MGLEILPLRIKITLEPDPLKATMLVGRLAVVLDEWFLLLLLLLFAWLTLCLLLLLLL